MWKNEKPQNISEELETIESEHIEIKVRKEWGHDDQPHPDKDAKRRTRYAPLSGIARVVINNRTFAV